MSRMVRVEQRLEQRSAAEVDGDDAVTIADLDVALAVADDEAVRWSALLHRLAK